MCGVVVQVWGTRVVGGYEACSGPRDGGDRLRDDGGGELSLSLMPLVNVLILKRLSIV